MSTSDSNCKDSASKSNFNDGVCEMNNKLQKLSTDDDDIIVSVCANCSKEGDNINNICNKCKMVKYCNATCKKKHRHKHKKDCEEHVRLAAERAAKLHDEALFKQPPQLEDCPICFICLPTMKAGCNYMACCGKVICGGCGYAPVYDDQGNKVTKKVCPFCRTLEPDTEDEANERLIKRVEADDAIAIYNLGGYHLDGTRWGFPRDYKKALELFHRAGELGNTNAYRCIGYAYDFGKGVEIDNKMAVHYYELAAMGGNEIARHNLGCIERDAGNFDRAIKHYIIAAKSGLAVALEKIKEMYSNGQATKEDFTKALCTYQEYLGEIKSAQRDKAATADEDNRYY